jgi:hypothetical protein
MRILRQINMREVAAFLALEAPCAVAAIQVLTDFFDVALAK